MKKPAKRSPKSAPRKTVPKKPSALEASKAVRKATSRAESYVNDPERLRKLFEDATKKSQDVPRGPFKQTWAYFMAMFRLIRSYANGSYREVPWQSLLMIIGAVIYFVSPIDLIPDFLPGGFIDDALVVSLVLKSVKNDLDEFMQWEATHGPGTGSALPVPPQASSPRTALALMRTPRNFPARPARHNHS